MMYFTLWSGLAGTSHVPLYQLIPLLHSEAKDLPIQITLMYEDKLAEQQKRQCQEMQGLIFEVWGDYAGEAITYMALLKQISKIYAPNVS